MGAFFPNHSFAINHLVTVPSVKVGFPVVVGAIPSPEDFLYTCCQVSNKHSDHGGARRYSQDVKNITKLVVQGQARCPPDGTWQKEATNKCRETEPSPDRR
ncbi:unnamed protein product [Ectocarpus sp. 13 AM-2016]